MKSNARLSQAVVFRFDYSLEIGFGHAVRCINFARKLNAKGHRVTAVVSRAETLRDDPGLARLSDFPGQSVIIENINDSIPQSATQDAAWVVFDGYKIQSALRGLVATPSARIARFSDWPQDVQDCALIIDLSSGASAADYGKWAAAQTYLCLGPEYFIPSSALEHARQTQSRQIGTGPKRIFASFGYGNIEYLCTTLLDEIAPFANKVARIDFAIASAVVPRLQEYLEKHRYKIDVRLYPDCTTVAELMAKADLSVGACGMTSWERCMLALPSICMALSPDQTMNFSRLAKAQAIIGVASPQRPDAEYSCFGAALGAILSDDARLTEISHNARSIVDGLGFERIYQHMRSELPRSPRLRTH